MKKFLVLFVSMLLVFGATLRAEETAAPATDVVIDATQPAPEVVQETAKTDAPKDKKNLETIEVSGVLEVIDADQSKKEKYKTVLLKVAEVTYRLLPNKSVVKNFEQLETLGGKTVKVKGQLLPANPPKYPLPAIKVSEFAE